MADSTDQDKTPDPPRGGRHRAVESRSGRISNTGRLVGRDPNQNTPRTSTQSWAERNRKDSGRTTVGGALLHATATIVVAAATVLPMAGCKPGEHGGPGRNPIPHTSTR